MTGKNSITDLIRFDLLEISIDTLEQFTWGLSKNEVCSFEKFYEQITNHTARECDVKIPLYLGHFELFELNKHQLEIVDGKQRLLSLLIILENILVKLKSEEAIDGHLELLLDKLNTLYSKRFSKVRNLQNVGDFLKSEYKYKDPAYLVGLFNTIENADFSQRIITNKEHKYQLQANLVRFASKPSGFKKFEAFCYNSALKSSGDETDCILKRFETDFKYIKSRFDDVRFAISEDELFEITIKCQENSLLSDTVKNSLDWFENSGTFKCKYEFIDETIKTLKALNDFFNHGPNTAWEIHEYINLKCYKTTLPIIIKAYLNNVPFDQIVSLTKSLTKLAFRHKIIGSLNSLGLRLDKHFIPFNAYNNSIEDFSDLLQDLMRGHDHPFMSHWSHLKLKKALDQVICHKYQKFILWVYENELREEKNPDVEPLCFYDLERFEVVNLNQGDHFKNEENTLGNLLLVHKEQKNLSTKEFFKSLSLLNQQDEVFELLKSREEWTKEMRTERQTKVRDIIYRKFR